jgi:hypothetical protein
MLIKICWSHGALYSEINRAEREPNHLYPSCSEVKNNHRYSRMEKWPPVMEAGYEDTE